MLEGRAHVFILFIACTQLQWLSTGGLPSYAATGCPCTQFAAAFAEVSETHATCRSLPQPHECGMQPVTKWHAKSLDQPCRRGREIARLFMERLLGCLWRPRPVLFVVVLEPITARDCRFACETYSGWDCCSCSGCGPRKSKFIIEIRVLQGACLQIGR